MSCFSELFARYPGKMGELCSDEAYDAGRPCCYIPEWPQKQDECALCPAPAFDNGEQTWHEQKRICESEECRSLWAWITAPGKEGGNKRREALKLHFGTRRIWDVPHLMRREAILAAMLVYEAKERANAGKPRLRVAA